MNRKRKYNPMRVVNRVYQAGDAVAARRFDERLELSTTYVLAGVVLAMEQAHCKVNYDKWFSRFAEIYPELIKDPVPYIKQAEEIIGGDIEIHWT